MLTTSHQCHQLGKTESAKPTYRYSAGAQSSPDSDSEVCDNNKTLFGHKT